MNTRKASLVRIAASFPKGSEERRALLVLAAKDYSAVVTEIDGKTISLKGEGHAALKKGISVPKDTVPGKPKVGDDYFATWKAGPNGGTWTFEVMKF